MRGWIGGLAGLLVAWGAGEPGNGGNGATTSDGGSGATSSTGGATTNGGAGGVGGSIEGCLPAWLGDGEFCDCFCGTADPDCDNPALPLYDDSETQCPDGQTCSPTFDGCVGLPTGWTCAEDQYDGGPGNGCDCDCGLPDPDCELEPAEPVEGCSSDEQCGGPEGIECIPGAWACDPLYFGDGTCDCGCGAADPSCPDAMVTSCAFCDLPGSCSSAECPGTINPTNNATCQ
jgi:hypothetical protein